MTRLRGGSALRRLARVRPTGRGGALLVAGAALVAGGVVLDLPDVVGLGAAAVLAVSAACLALGWQRLDAGRGALDVERDIEPDPVVAGRSATTRLTVRARARTGAAYERLARLRLSEQAAHELAGPSGIRAHVRAHPDRIAVQYSLSPVRRGRWPLGPVLTTRTDVFGLARTTQPLGGATRVSVWPRTTPLPARAAALGDVDRAAVGARLASSDDSVLREYVPGDDPRRVHWAGSARQGRLMVRADESAGLRPVTVLLDRGLLAPPPDERPGARPPVREVVDDGEWAVELAASVATSFLDAGHPTRLVATTTTPARTDHAAGRGSGRAQLLDATVDLTGLRGSEAAEALTTTARSLRADRARSEVTVAVIAPTGGGPQRHAVASLGADGVGWALLVVPRATGMRHDVDPTADDLRAAGWHVASCTPGTPVARAWSLLTESAA
ncbi:uncharacterized protein (DUF58 family) [Isoptericola sp. CG 20/1183]|uniref:Uncharacterized protein (DUF58 family) n=1 Tax=Isoptericola halotolerans TaxID=300560 RepID=A0ABX5ECR6_9MICO|nr:MULTISPECIES: DUF58 domain-containing protein [Isoptericola]PRZ05586.1 uncharacterized protein (DUF58 family) [Isoptericola halotolerans]PRZ06154.1 uncharacterized protein (DUF58 family) [Isoptericola sp. CG 20/1183]